MEELVHSKQINERGKKNKSPKKKFALFVVVSLPGEKNGEKIGKRYYTVVNYAKRGNS